MKKLGDEGLPPQVERMMRLIAAEYEGSPFRKVEITAREIARSWSVYSKVEIDGQTQWSVVSLGSGPNALSQSGEAVAAKLVVRRMERLVGEALRNTERRAAA